MQITKDEAELYDRQIRLWGFNAQSRIRQSKVLMIGFNGVASEVAKILVLAGIDTLTIVDNEPFQPEDSTSNLFCRPNQVADPKEKPQFRTHAVKEKLRILNPLVKVNIDNSSIQTKNNEYYKNYNLVTLHLFLTIPETSAINEICRAHNTKFYTVLDFGFFGFVFNDLGPKFEFTYEEFTVSKEKLQTGEARDPISVGDEAPLDEPVDSNDDSDEENRPKKRRRLHSPPKESTTKVENEKTTKKGSLPFSRFEDMISLRSTTFSKSTSPVLLLSIAMYKFYTSFKHLPRNQNDEERREDISELNSMLISLRNSLPLNDSVFKKLDNFWSESIYGSLSPVCAAVGGVAGQDMIRALSGKDIPLHNTFSFDGMSMNGVVEKVGITDASSKPPMPIIRDILQIDDDD